MRRDFGEMVKFDLHPVVARTHDQFGTRYPHMRVDLEDYEECDQSTPKNHRTSPAACILYHDGKEFRWLCRNLEGLVGMTQPICLTRDEVDISLSILRTEEKASSA